MNKEELETKNKEEADNPQEVYEVGYLILPSISEENIEEEVVNLKNSISETGASFISEEPPSLIGLAYEMTRTIGNKKHRFNNGYFGWIKFEIEAKKIREIKEVLDKNEKLIRFLLIKTVRESTLSPKRSYLKQESAKRKTASNQDEKEKAEPIDEEAIDKEIEALIS